MKNMYRVNTSVLKGYNQNLNKEKSFINSSYKTFSDGYICSCSNSLIQTMRKDIDALYKKVGNSYTEILKWFDEYIDDNENLDKSLQSRNNRVQDRDTYSYISTFISLNQNEIKEAPVLLDEIKLEIKTIQNTIDSRLNSLDDKLAYIEKYGEEEGTRRYNEDYQKLKTEYDEYENILSGLKNIEEDAVFYELVSDFLSNPEYLQIQGTLNLLLQIKNSIEEELNTANLTPDEREKVLSSLAEIKYNISLLEQEKKRYLYSAILNTSDYFKFINNYDEEAIVKSYVDLTTSEGVTDYLTMYEYYKNTVYGGRDDLNFEEANQLDVFGGYMIAPYMDIETFYNYTTEDQRMLYHYIYKTKGEKAARQYADSLIDSINGAIGAEKATEFIEEFEYYYASQNSSDPFESIVGFIATNSKVTIQGLSDGIESFSSSILNSNNPHLTADEYATALIYQYLGEKSDYYKTKYAVDSAIGRLAPIITINVVANYAELPNAIGKTVFFLSSFGDAHHYALVNDYDSTAAILYSIISGLTEVGLEYFLGNIPGLSKESGFTLSQILGEGFEEYIEEYLDAAYKYFLFGEPFDFEETNKDAWNAFFIALLVTTKINGVDAFTKVVINGETWEIDINKLKDELAKIASDNNNRGSINLAAIGVKVNYDSEMNKALGEFEKITKEVCTKYKYSYEDFLVKALNLANKGDYSMFPSEYRSKAKSAYDSYMTYSCYNQINGKISSDFKYTGIINYNNQGVNIMCYKFENSYGLEIYIQYDFDTKTAKYTPEKVIKEYVNAYRSCPELFSNSKTLVVTSTENPSDSYWSDAHKRDFHSAATGGDGKITLYRYYNCGTDCLYHEAGHNYEFARSNFTNNMEYVNAMNADGNYTSKYGEESFDKRNSNQMTEDFADFCGKYYAKGKNYVKKKYPNRVEYLRKYQPKLYNAMFQ